MKIIEFDVFVIGSGVAGQLVAKSCAKANLKVAIADNREYGGTCANRGCDAKKVLLGPTEVYQHALNLKGKGITSVPNLDWEKLQNFKRTFTDRVPLETEKILEKLGVKRYHQSPVFIDKNTLSVEGKTVKAKKIVIATGQIPRTLKVLGNNLLKTSDYFLKMKQIPDEIVFIGAGYIAMEFAHIAARNGSKVTILDHGSRALNGFDPDLVSELISESEKMGIQFIFNAKVTEIEKLRTNYRIIYKIKNEETSLKAKLVFNTAGRVPAIANLHLEKGDIDYSIKGVSVNKYLQNTSNPNVYACGDVSDHSLPLTPLSGIEAKVVAENILHGNKKQIETPIVPSVVFSLPNLATVGLSEEEATTRYKDLIVNYQSVPNWYNAKRIKASVYAYKILVNKRNNHIVGAHILGPHAAETINLFSMAMHQKMTTNDIKNMIFTYPSWGSDIKSMI
ncbi:dihydrolipoyl dehydrogenase family protein [Xanthomarina sp. F2636L]|uniref:dihydrolipoyl dehydrogenase family protein n=1 Tax=Xanthomarina sp. F2636L TaxID=2996018 RepID=UPI00225DF852|nr:NAD(P)/FAD-dependent oxidoreductase [Xanthomarina sp. F2636L]MCX7550070.1 NAD(P)/FAD-dependent oxidoreductase [Xanthomarina sp. F2636L]